ncbi:MAG: ATP-binding cassette domain-containing protein [Gemmatimonadetes bacterium]|nr:ATP-binding cassette domain-containing protein [Gemmatimonadota bacterium]
MVEFSVRTRGVRKTFGTHTAVSDFDLEVPAGTIYGLLGPNGSGKTTMIRMIMGILLPDQGEIELFGTPPDFRSRSRIGYLPEERGVYEKMRVLDQLAFLGEIRGIERGVARVRAGEWLERLGLGAWVDRKVEDLSKGMQQKVQFIGTVLHDPDLMILDEPFSGLDPINQEVLESIVREEQQRGKTILFSTHLMEQAERLCERVCLISNAKKVLDGDLRALRRQERTGMVALEFDGEDEWLDAPWIRHITPAGDAVHVTLEDGTEPSRLMAAALQAGVELRRFELVEPSLREIFVRHAGAPPGDESASLGVAS